MKKEKITIKNKDIKIYRGTRHRAQGITLVSLVITIVVLIILASVAIYLNLGENGIFNRAKQAKQYYEVAANNEKMLLSDTSNEIDSYIDNNKELYMKREMKIDTLNVIGTGVGSIKQGFTKLIIDTKDYSKLTFGTLNMASTNYNRFYLFNGKHGEEGCEEVAKMMSERSGESGIFENMEWDISQYDFITIFIESGRGDEVYIKDITLM